MHSVKLTSFFISFGHGNDIKHFINIDIYVIGRGVKNWSILFFLMSRFDETTTLYLFHCVADITETSHQLPMMK